MPTLKNIDFFLIQSLISDKSEPSRISKDIVHYFYFLLKNRQEQFLSWKQQFTKLHGDLDTQRHTDSKDISFRYKLDVNTKDDLFMFIYSLEIYYSIILKLITYKVMVGNKINKQNLNSVLSGEYLLDKKILNYDNEILYTWFIDLKNQDFNVFESVKPLLTVFNLMQSINYDGDFIKIIYESIFPRTIRHSMGEFYTPDWLASFVIDTLVNSDKQPQNKKYLDPSCGSGTFLVEILNKFSSNSNLIENIYGIDLNPLSALAAKTNILINLKGKINTDNNHFVIPIFNTDTINSSFFDNINDLFTLNAEDFTFELEGKTLTIPRMRISYNELKNIYISLIVKRKISLNITAAGEKLYLILQSAHLSQRQLTKFLSIFAPYTLNDIDYIVGNPPWVNWEYLPKDYKSKTINLWKYYGLFDFKGRDFCFIKEDISSLFTYVVIDRHLKDGGKIGFVIKETLFKSAKQGEGFRKFTLGNNGKPIGVFRVDDLTNIKPFNGINNRTALFFAEKNVITNFPIKFIVWKSTGMLTINQYEKLEDVTNRIFFELKVAKPVEKHKLNSGWITYDEKTDSSSGGVLGKSSYKARTGTFTGGANAVYWLKILEASNNLVKVSNINERAKIKVKQVSEWVEKDYVYPLISGSELNFWKYGYSKYIILPHTKKTKMFPVDIDTLRMSVKTLNYFNLFKTELRARKGFASWERKILETYFYSLQRIGEYTFAEYKVAWRYISKNFITAVITRSDDAFLKEKIIIPNEKIIYIGLSDKIEAYYLCGLLSSDKYRKTIENYMSHTQITPSILEKLNIPKFDLKNDIHTQISLECEMGHHDEYISPYLGRINILVDTLLENKNQRYTQALPAFISSPILNPSS